MEFWLLAGLGVYLLQVYGVTIIYMPTEGLMNHMGSRDNLPEKGVMTERMDRALVNMKENLPLFITLGLMVLIVEGADQALAVKGAMIWVLARLAYVVLYLISIPLTRSVAWTVSMVGLVMMLVSVL